MLYNTETDPLARKHTQQGRTRNDKKNSTTQPPPVRSASSAVRLVLLLTARLTAFAPAAAEKAPGRVAEPNDVSGGGGGGKSRPA